MKYYKVNIFKSKKVPGVSHLHIGVNMSEADIIALYGKTNKGKTVTISEVNRKHAKELVEVFSNGIALVDNVQSFMGSFQEAESAAIHLEKVKQLGNINKFKAFLNKMI